MPQSQFPHQRQTEIKGKDSGESSGIEHASFRHMSNGCVLQALLGFGKWPGRMFDLPPYVGKWSCPKIHKKNGNPPSCPPSAPSLRRVAAWPGAKHWCPPLTAQLLEARKHSQPSPFSKDLDLQHRNLHKHAKRRHVTAIKYIQCCNNLRRAWINYLDTLNVASSGYST